MFEEYLQDAFDFWKRANDADDPRVAKRYYRAAVFYAFGALESFVNYLADSFVKAKTLTDYERAFLNDKVLTLDIQNGKLIEKSEYHKIEEKIRYLLRSFNPEYDFNNAIWSNVLEFKKLRDGLVHPRKSDDDTSVEDYEKQIRRGLTGTIRIIDSLLQNIFGKPLRKQLMDLIPD